MCDYSLERVESRAANVGDQLVSISFSESFTRGFTAADNAGAAVCLLAGTELAFEHNVEYDHPLASWFKKNTGHNVARFRRINLDRPYEHHDALEFPDGQVILVTRLCPGQRATVLQLPAEAQAIPASVVTRGTEGQHAATELSPSASVSSENRRLAPVS
jgi:hypothetical protein